MKWKGVVGGGWVGGSGLGGWKTRVEGSGREAGRGRGWRVVEGRRGEEEGGG